MIMGVNGRDRANVSNKNRGSKQQKKSKEEKKKRVHERDVA